MHLELISALPFAKQAMIPKAGHASYAEYPEQVTKHIKEFAMKTWRASSNSPAKNN
jgi:pimeloyl-ACP methyl ester carboxylesterase